MDDADGGLNFHDDDHLLVAEVFVSADPVKIREGMSNLVDGLLRLGENRIIDWGQFGIASTRILIESTGQEAIFLQACVVGMEAGL